MTRKKFLITLITLFIIVAATLVGGYYYLINTKPAPDPVNNEVTGSLAETETPSIDTTNDIMSTSTPGAMPRLRHLTTEPVAGYDFVDTPNGFVIWYVERSNGNIFQTATSTAAVTRITSTNIPKVYEARIGKGGSKVILRTLSDAGSRAQTFIGTPQTKGTSTTKDLVGIFTSDSISQLSLSPLKESFFGITEGGQTGIGNLYSFAAKSTAIFSHPLKKWIPQWVNASSIIMTSAPSAKTQNISYILNPSTKSFTKLLGPKNGLVVSASPSGTRMVFSENESNTLSFGVYDSKTSVETSIGNSTIPDKCVWSKKDNTVVYCGFPKSVASGSYPDDWYQGKTLFNDTLRSLDTDTFQFNTILDLESASRTQIDATNLMLSKDEKYLLFTNKADLTLWMLEL